MLRDVAVLPRDVAILALGRMSQAPDFSPGWSPAEAALLRREAVRLLQQSSDAARFLAPHAEQLVAGIGLVPFLAPDGGPFGPAWSGHPFFSPAIGTGYKLSEPQLTRELARLMGHGAAGQRGPERATSFLRILTDLAGQSAILDTLREGIQPTVTAEHVVSVQRKQAPRIDLLFEWPVGTDARRAVVAVEAKFGAVVGDQQLIPYRQEAKRRAKGGPVTLILLTAKADKAERRHPSWSAVRWFALMRRWETVLAAAGDDDPEFARVRAHIWRFISDLRGAVK